MLRVFLIALQGILYLNGQLTPPRNLQATGYYDQIHLSWEPPLVQDQSVVSYRIHLRNNLQNQLLDTNNSNTFYHIRHIFFTIQYTFYVKAQFGVNIFSDWSNIAQITVSENASNFHSSVSVPFTTDTTRTTGGTSTKVTSNLSQTLIIVVIVLSVLLVLMMICISTVLIKRYKQRQNIENSLRAIQIGSYEKLRKEGSTDDLSTHIYDSPQTADYTEVL